jgi:hypothetical protein
MTPAEYIEMAADCKEMIDESGREVTFYKLDGTPTDASKPWRGTQPRAKIAPQVVQAVFVVPNTSIPTESRGLAFDWIDQELLKRARHVCIIAAQGLPDMEGYNVVTAERDYAIIWGQCLQPGSTRLLYVFGLAQ